ncbi:hypothetical protein A3F08_00580 [Candidatus Berkelbacteria bacterium RIFCSPHIGHO2_12_FULL_36_9]|uniref:TNFR-Cys domain-containing protein n=1 Tax=Candidatus Berkelbacteria bacterium RIFCSPHIGHO2_12_FULL_36_9 TaxID=1797469 RepID=A0A1F5EF88_9BACT|nr:MAG: hypothetical protein A3F08_00580 [Candidatus Berkelbacteria bacterium RIFCSPHIGHO2_12_FULL_36_9]
MYSDQCDLCQKPIVSLFSPDKPFQVYCQECWWSDKWDPIKYGREFDFSRPFFEQFQEFQKSVPRLSIFNLNSTNSEYTNHSSSNKNCYMGLGFADDEDCMYGHWLMHSKDCLDMLYCEHCEECYECIYCRNCNNTFFSQYCQNVRDSLICFECKSCENCIGCVQLQHKKYHILNKEVSKDEFEKTKNEILSSPKKFQEMLELSVKLKQTVPHRYSFQLNCQNCVGDDLYDSKNSYFCFNCREIEDCKYMYDLGSNKDSMDCYEHGWLVPSELNYEAHAGMAGYHLLFCNICADSRDLIYCDLCFNNSRNNFGCVGLKKKEYCILNKQYTKEGYEELVTKIIEHMKMTGEWGEFFPSSMSLFGYNETAAQEYFSLTKNEAIKNGFKWQDEDFSMKYDGPFYEPKDILEYLNNEQERQKLLSGILKCFVSGKPF